jgi:hypothetical protein
VREIHSETAKEDYVAEAINDVLHEVQAARRDLFLTGFCLRQVEATRRIDRVTADSQCCARKRPAEASVPPGASMLGAKDSRGG